MLSGPVCAMVWEGRDAVKTGRGFSHLPPKVSTYLKMLQVLLGATNPLASAPGTIRGDYAIVSPIHGCDVTNLMVGKDVGRNVCHGSDSVENAKKEIALWFGNKGDVIEYTSAQFDWVYEKA